LYGEILDVILRGASFGENIELENPIANIHFTMLKILLTYRFLSSIAHIATILSLAVIFMRDPFAFESSQIALCVGIYALADRGSAIIWSFFIPRLSYKNSLLASTSLCMMGMLGICLYHSLAWCAAMLSVVGFGLSLEGLVTRLWISNISENQERINGFSWMARIMNAGYMIGSSAIFMGPATEHGIFLFGFIGFVYLFSFLFIFKFFNENQAARPIKEALAAPRFKQVLIDCRSHMAYITGYSFVFFMTIFALCQSHLLPFYFAKTATIPSYLGMALAINPLLIVCFQGRVTQLFKFLNAVQPLSPFVLGFIMLGGGFAALALLNPPINIWIFISLLTGGEMLISPHIDYSLSLKLPIGSRPFIFAIISLTFSLGRMTSESGGITALEILTHMKKDLNLWWSFNSVLMIFLGAAIYIFSQFKNLRKETKDEYERVGSY
jgi:MFS family permease